LRFLSLQGFHADGGTFGASTTASNEIAEAARDTVAYEAACTAYFVTSRDRSQTDRMAAALAALMAVRPETPRARAAVESLGLRRR
jgi:hypothetical protein